jgi:hypothetical protein
MATHCYFTFPTTYFAIRAEQLLKGQPFLFKMVPVPRRISSSCGTALRCACGDVEAIGRLFVEYGLETEGVHAIEEKELRSMSIRQKGSP